MSALHPVERAAKVIGSQAAMATALGVSRAAVSQWMFADRRVPAEHCPTIERLTRERGEPVMCEELRPDIPWGVLRERAAPEIGAEGAPATPEPANTEAGQ